MAQTIEFVSGRWAVLEYRK